MDILRHAGAARLAEFAGGSEANLAMDRAQLRSAFYTRREARRRSRRPRSSMAPRAGASCAAQTPTSRASTPPRRRSAPAARSPDRTARSSTPRCRSSPSRGPAPTSRTSRRSSAASSARAAAARRPTPTSLQRLYGSSATPAASGSTRTCASATTPRRRPPRAGGFPYGTGEVSTRTPPASPCPTSVGRPRPAPGTRSAADEPGRSYGTDRPDVVDGPFGPIPLNLDEQGMSNALVVGVGALQHRSPDRRVRTADRLLRPAAAHRGGAGRPARQGARCRVRRGQPGRPARSRGRLRVVGDQRVQRQRRHRGRAPLQHRRQRPTIRSHAYLAAATCVEMDRRVHTETGVPTAAGPTPPEVHRFRVLRTHHGIVLLRTTVDGRPVAIVTQRSTYGREVRLGRGVRPAQRPGVHRRRRSRSSGPSTRSTTRSTGSTPTTATSPTSPPACCRSAPPAPASTCRGGVPAVRLARLAAARRAPAAGQPAQGYLVSWNNKTAPGFAAADDVYGYGSVYRSLALEDRITAAVRGPGDGRRGHVTA